MNKGKPLSLFLLEEPNYKQANKIKNYFVKKFEVSKVDLEINPTKFILTNGKYRKLKRKANKKKDFAINYRWFYNVRLNIKKGVFVPQPDTEGIIDLILQHYQNSNQNAIKGFEVGTGTGAIPIALTKNNDKIIIRTVEKKLKPFKLSQVNAIENDVYEKITFCKSDFLKSKDWGNYDFIVSNPPYIDKRDKTIEKSAKKSQPAIALYAKHSGIEFYQKIFNMAEKSLKVGGMIFLEIGYNQKQILEKIIPATFKNYKFYKNYNKNFRFLVLEK